MVRRTPILAAITLLVAMMVLWHTDRRTPPVPVGNVDGAPPAPGCSSAAPRDAANGEDFAPFPRVGTSRADLHFTSTGHSETAENDLPSARSPRSATVGHHRIPPEVRGLTSTELRDRMPPEMRARLLRYERDLADFEPEHRRYFCWGPDTPPEVVEAYRRVEVAAGLAPGPVRALAFQFVGGGHWSRTATDGSPVDEQGLPVTLTWSIVPDGTTTPGDGDPDAPSELIAWLDSLYPESSTWALTQKMWFPFFEEAMADLAAQCGISLVFEPNDDAVEIAPTAQARGQIGAKGDIRIAARNIDGNGGTLAFAYSPSFGDVVLESYDSYYNNKTNDSRRLVNVLTHEIGHTLGLDHVCPADSTKLMEPFINTSFRGARFDETYALQRQYGDELEVHSGLKNNDSAANASSIAVAVGSGFTGSSLSIDDDSDIDYLSFAASGGESLTVRAIPSDPVGSGGTYLEGPQENAGSCSAGSPFDPTSQQNLTLELLDTNGSTVLATADGEPAGQTEELLEVSLPAAGTYYLRINGGSANTSQMYELQAEITSAVASLTLADLTTVFNGAPQGATVTTDPAGLATLVTYGGSPAIPSAAGTYAVSAIVIDPLYTGGTSGNLVIAKAPAAITLGALEVLYDGSPQPVNVTTAPNGLTVLVTYDDSGSAPSSVGGYAVSAMVTDLNYEGTTGGTLTIGPSFVSWGEGFGLTSSDPLNDDDDDGWLAIAEYIYDTNPADDLSAPTLDHSLGATTFSLVTPPPVDRPDAEVRGETSTDLLQWTSEGVIDTGTGFSVPRVDPGRYLRLRFSHTPRE